jgi:F-type H+-transporting ATPase subunit beta
LRCLKPTDLRGVETAAARSSEEAKRFETGVPALRQKLVTREPGAVVMEVAVHVDAHTVRCLALTPTRGLARGAIVVDTGGPLRVPIGTSVLGRMLNVFGEVIDGGAPLADVAWRSIHGAPVPLARRAISDETSRRVSR